MPEGQAQIPESSRIKLVVFGLGYSGTALAEHAVALGLCVTVVSRKSQVLPPQSAKIVAFEAAAEALSEATHIVSTAAPTVDGDPVLARWHAAISQCGAKWFGYLSSTSVYGDRDGDWVDETTQPRPTSQRGVKRVAAETAWCETGQDLAVDIFRLAGIYGPGRSAFDDLQRGHGRRISKPGHLFGRIHRDDIAGAILAAACQDAGPGRRIFNLSDDEPASQADVLEEAAHLLGCEVPPLIPFAEIASGMTEMALSFWADNRRVSSVQTQRQLNRRWLYPTYRQGLRAVHARADKSPKAPG